MSSQFLRKKNQEILNMKTGEDFARFMLRTEVLPKIEAKRYMKVIENVEKERRKEIKSEDKQENIDFDDEIFDKYMDSLIKKERAIIKKLEKG